jgi:hypothetical protein
MSLPTVFDNCRPCAEVLAETIGDRQFMAGLSRVGDGRQKDTETSWS